MRKYLECAKVQFKTQLHYRFYLAVTALITVTKILFANIVWGTIFGERTVVAGFTIDTMLTYYVLSSFLSGMDISDGVSGEISSRIRNGTFSKYMVIPVHMEGYFHAQNYGATALYVLLNLVVSVVWVLLFQIRFTILAGAAVILSAVLLIAMGLVFMVQLNFFLGILTFKLENIGTFLMIKGALVAFVTGSMVPLALLPAGVVSWMRFLPFYYVTYLPTMLLIGRNAEEVGAGLMTLAVWVALFAIVNPLVYNGMRRRYDGVGI